MPWRQTPSPSRYLAGMRTLVTVPRYANVKLAAAVGSGGACWGAATAALVALGRACECPPAAGMVQLWADLLQATRLVAVCAAAEESMWRRGVRGVGHAMVAGLKRPFSTRHVLMAWDPAVLILIRVHGARLLAVRAPLATGSRNLHQAILHAL